MLFSVLCQLYREVVKMTNMEKWANTMELLHEIQPAPFNPNYDEKVASRMESQEKFMYELRQVLTNLEFSHDYTLLDKVEDMVYLYVSAINEFYGYKLEDGKITHKTERGQKLIEKTFEGRF